MRNGQNDTYPCQFQATYFRGLEKKQGGNDGLNLI